MLPEPGSLFDRYRVEEPLGEGGMGRVYRAFDERLQRWVALKILHPAVHSSGASEPGARSATEGAARLLREARAAAALDHPNAVAIFDVGEVRAAEDETPTPFIAMELIEGRSLRAFIGASSVSLAEKLHWLTDVARALAASHARGLVHRDVKPENVMIRHDGVVKVLDFGIARRAPSGKVDAEAPTQARVVVDTLTADGVVVGTPFYMSPEQMRGETIDGRADQFSWGVVAYELLSGNLPWDREGDALKIVSEVLTKQPPALRSVAPDVPAIVEAAVMRALAKAPGDRLASMDALVVALETSAHGGPRSLPPAVAEALGSAPTVQSTRTSLASAAKAVTARSLRARRVRGAIVGGLLVVAATSTALVALRPRARPQAPAAPAAQAPPATAGLLDLPRPRTTPEALAVYEEFLRARREGDDSRFVEAGMHAVELDPKLAPALMRLGISLFDFMPERAREYFSRAVENRESLTPRDLAFLDAFEPYVQRDPSDRVETRARLAALALRYPGDAEIVFVNGRQEEKAGELDRALTDYRRAIQIDPGFVLPFRAEIETLAWEKGDFDGAIAASASCEKLAPGDPACFFSRDRIYIQRGECSALEEDARRLIARRPKSSTGYLLAAEALSVRGDSSAAVRELVAQVRSRTTDEKAISETLRDVHLAELEGDFDKADALLRAGEKESASAAAEEVHGIYAWERMQLALETGQRPAEYAIASDFRARRAAWTKPPSRSPGSSGEDHGVPILEVLAEGGKVTRDELAESRTEWLRRWAGTPRAAPYAWFVAYAEGAGTPDDARAALEALPLYEPLPALWDFTTASPIGRTYFLAGRFEQAIRYLRQATEACDALDAPFDHVRAYLYLGRALEATNDATGACAAYKAVLARWGSAKPRSATADAARARAGRCAR